MIPKIVHQTWRSDTLPSVFQSIYDKNKEVNPKYDFKLWSHSPGPPDIDKFIEKEYPDVYPIFANCKYGVQKADIARLAILHHYGGIYIDLDILCLKHFESFIDHGSDFVFASMEPVEQTMAVFKKDNLLCNAFIAAPAKHEVFRKALDIIITLIKNNGDSIYNIFNVFGADIVSSAMTSSEEILSNCRYINRDLIYPISDPKLTDLPSCEKCIKMIKDGDYKDAYMVHYWIHSDFESKEKVESFKFDSKLNVHENMYQFFKELYPQHKYLRN